MSSLYDIKKYIKNNIWVGKSIGRHKSVQDKYDKCIHDIKNKYESLGHYIKIIYFNYIPVKLKHVNKYISINHLYSISLYNGIIIKNKYPYKLDSNIIHLIYWSSNEQGIYKIIDVIKKNNEDENDYLWFTNELKNKSIPDIWHAHILLTKQLYKKYFIKKNKYIYLK